MPKAKSGSSKLVKKGCRLGVTAKEKGLDSPIGPMGASPYIMIFEGSSDKVTVLNNPGLGHGSRGGMMAADAMVSNGVDVVITGTIGKVTLDILKEAGVRVHGGCEEQVRSAMEKCLKDELPECQHGVFAGYIGN
ncbi:MAG: Dinitrogenase iron-molybdenum cofactor [Methanomassiliicoccales archaeon PtaU1.Bin124]|nr:MAG: Dinitrogenase iron-molybdenum cofactor [Methanomassiliicoccales archaeon PtaU1.Bin124]